MPLRLAIQQNLLPEDDLETRFHRAAELGFDGIELNHSDAFDVRQEVDSLASISERSGVQVAAICTTNAQDPVIEDIDERNRRVTELVELVDAASALGASGVISVPIRPSAGFDEAPLPELALDIYGRILGHLGEGEAKIFLEPLNRYEARFLNRVGQAAILARMMNNSRVQALADLYHMNIEEAAFDTPIDEAGSLLGHVHLADNTRDEPGAGMLDFSPAFQALHRIEYDGWMSLECRGLSGPAETALPACVTFLRDTWSRTASNI